LPKKPLISIVDDDDALRDAMNGLMRAFGFRVRAFASAEDFLKFNDLSNTAYLIADVQMPHMSGLELHHRLLASGISIPTILITAYPEDSVRARAFEAGVVGYLTKPFSKNDLLACIRSTRDLGEVGMGQKDNSGSPWHSRSGQRLLCATDAKKDQAGCGGG
jgi:FixJ family two-component response regulator